MLPPLQSRKWPSRCHPPAPCISTNRPNRRPPSGRWRLTTHHFRFEASGTWTFPRRTRRGRRAASTSASSIFTLLRRSLVKSLTSANLHSMPSRLAIPWKWNDRSFATTTTTISSCPSGATTRLSATGTRPSITAPGCRLRSAGLTSSGLAERLSLCTSLVFWLMGISVYRDKITLPVVKPTGNEFREWISAAHIVWAKENPEFLAEFANVNHRNILTNAITNNQAYYAQIAYRLPWLEKTLKPYYRFEHTHTPLSEQVFTNQDLVESILGLRYDITNYASFKGEYRNTKRLPTEPRVNGAFFQTDFTF